VLVPDRLTDILEESRAAISGADSLPALEELRVRLLGRKGTVTSLLHGLKDLPPAERPAAGQAANRIKEELSRLLEEKAADLKRASWTQGGDAVPDPTLPGRPPEMGHVHILNQTLEAIEAIFASMGFSVAEGPEVETDYYNFTAMNFPPDHPARDMHDTFFISQEVLLRTHTSPVQVRLMERQQPPIRAIMPGKTYRCDDDATHSPMFHQVEGLMVDRNISFADLKAVLTLFVRRMFGEQSRLRFRPSFFPFTEPSAEVDMSCMKCQGAGCSLCKGSGWIEILGSGMVHPAVLTMGGIDPNLFTGFAFGMGVERVAMIKYGIDNMRYFFENDLRFLEQF
jgi:phenylalanyl-tRNA synthetase alpha chain